VSICDLTVRKLISALFHLYRDGQMPEPFRVVGFARREKTDASWFLQQSDERLD
jgi:glucose-6-phosphate 1-dehydrogenase